MTPTVSAAGLIVEAMARAMFVIDAARIFPDDTWDEASHASREGYRSLAAAALHAGMTALLASLVSPERNGTP